MRGDAQQNGVGVDCESYERIEVLEADSSYPVSLRTVSYFSQIHFLTLSSFFHFENQRNTSPIIESIDLTQKSIQLDPAPYHSSFDALVIPRRLFRELDLEVRIPVATSVNRGKRSPVTIPARAAFLQTSNPESIIQIGSVRTKSNDSHKKGDQVISEFTLKDMESRGSREEPPVGETIGMLARKLGRTIFPKARQEPDS